VVGAPCMAAAAAISVLNRRLAPAPGRGGPCAFEGQAELDAWAFEVPQWGGDGGGLEACKTGLSGAGSEERGGGRRSSTSFRGATALAESREGRRGESIVPPCTASIGSARPTSGPPPTGGGGLKEGTEGGGHTHTHTHTHKHRSQQTSSRSAHVLTRRGSRSWILTTRPQQAGFPLEYCDCAVHPPTHSTFIGLRVRGLASSPSRAPAPRILA
jgi:hypothetical protein